MLLSISLILIVGMSMAWLCQRLRKINKPFSRTAFHPEQTGVYGRLFLFSPEAFFFFPDKTSGAERTEQVARTKEERARSSSSSVIRKCGLAPG